MSAPDRHSRWPSRWERQKCPRASHFPFQNGSLNEGRLSGRACGPSNGRVGGASCRPDWEGSGRHSNGSGRSRTSRLTGFPLTCSRIYFPEIAQRTWRNGTLHKHLNTSGCGITCAINYTQRRILRRIDQIISSLSIRIWRKIRSLNGNP